LAFNCLSLIKEEKVGGVLPKFGYKYLIVREEGILFYGKPESSCTTESYNTFAFRLAILMNYPTFDGLEYRYA